jgi:pyruvate-formate lyase-activating enzyme
MGALFAWPSELKTDSAGLALTFIVPASACNLNCGFCAIKQRREAERSVLSATDYAYFLEDVVRNAPLAIAAIQGYEPLLLESWPYTMAILKVARRFQVPTGLVTNGILLAERTQDLMDLEPTGVTVSLDSAIPNKHDKLRGQSGAFAKTITGLQSLVGVPQYAKRVTISSVLFPRHRKYLEGMPRLLSDLGISHWVISPLLRIGSREAGGPVGSGWRIIEDLLFLRDRAAQCGVSLVLDDELGMLADGDYADLVVRQFQRPDGLLRLVPNGACSVGKDILRRVGTETAVWRPSEITPHDFVRSILSPVMRSSVLSEAA